VRFIGSVLRHDPFAVRPTMERQLGMVLDVARSLPAA
jgi:hypothetical protein